MSQLEEPTCDGNFTSFSGVLSKSSKSSYENEKNNIFTDKAESPLLTPDSQSVNSLFQYDNGKSSNYINEESNHFAPKVGHEFSNELNSNSLNTSCFEHEHLINEVCTNFLSQNHEPNSSNSKLRDEFVLEFKSNSSFQFNLSSTKQTKSSKSNYDYLGLTQLLEDTQKSLKESTKKCSEDFFPFLDLLKSPSFCIPSVASNDALDTLHSDSSLFGFDITKAQSLFCELSTDQIINKLPEKFALKDSDGSVLLKVHPSVSNTDTLSVTTNNEYSCGEESIELLLIELDEKLAVKRGRKKKFADTETEEINVTLQDSEISTSNSENKITYEQKCNISDLETSNGLVTEIETKKINDTDEQNLQQEHKKISSFSDNLKTTEVNNKTNEVDLKESGEPLFEIVNSYRCKSCLQIYSDKHLLLKHCAEKHELQNEPFLIKVNTSDPTGRQKSSESAVFVPSPKCIVLKDVALFICNHCQTEFMSEGLYMQHVKDCHREDSSPSERAIRVTEKRGLDDINLQANHSFPNKKFKNCDDDDVWKEDNGRKFQRPTTKRPFPLLKDFVPRNLRCGMFGCPHRFSSVSNLEKHQSCHDFHSYSKTKFACYECEEEFSKWNNCCSHLWRSHSIDVDMLRCGMCSSFRSLTAHQMSVHQETHSESKSYACRHCSAAFRQLSQLLNHEETHARNGDRTSSASVWSQRAMCNVCTKWFASYRTYLEHYQSVHVKLKKFSCPHCDYGCTKKSRMTDHLKTHSDLKPYSCELCPFSCSDRNTIRRHRLKHLTTKHLKCPAQKCSLKTVHDNFFRKHVKTKHLDQNLSYSCEFCSYESHHMENYISHCSIHAKQIISDLISNAKKNGKEVERRKEQTEINRKNINPDTREALSVESEFSSYPACDTTEKSVGVDPPQPRMAPHRLKLDTKDFEAILVCD